MMKKALAATALTAVLAALAPQDARAAEPVQLKFGNPGAPKGHVSLRIITPFAERMTKDSNGTVEFKLYSGPSLGTFPVIYDRIINGVADLSFGLLGPISSQFPKTLVASLPFETPNSKTGTLAMWHMVTSGVIADEWQRVKPLVLMVFPSSLFHAHKPIKTLADVQGLKFSVQSRLLAESVEKLGGAPITLAVTDLYQALQRGTVDVVTIGWPATASYKLAEVSTYHLAVPIGGEVTYIAMNKDSYAKLPAAGRAAVDKNIGDDFSRHVGEILDEVDEEESSKVRAMPGETVAKLAPDEETKWKARVAPVTEAWAKSTPDGEKVLAAYRAEIAKISGHK
jgi:TRAP-type C4-dicarboxylate transport system substrate-binding protein